MMVSPAQRRHWQERLAREQEAGSLRLERALPVARSCAAALQRRWPQIQGVWLFGSAVEGRFRMDSDIDLAVERGKLTTLVESLRQIAPTADQQAGASLWVDAAALRLQSFSTGIELCCVLIVRVFNGATPEGGDWHRLLLERMGFANAVRPAVLSAATVRGLGELLRFRHVVRHLYAYELDAEQVRQLRQSGDSPLA